MMIGVPLEAETEVVDTSKTILYENGSTISKWVPSPPEVYEPEGFSEGSMYYDGSSLVPYEYGPSKTRMHGPNRMIELPLTGDFEVEMRGQLLSNVAQMGRFGFHVLDDQMRHIGMMSTIDVSRGIRNKQAEGRVGPFIGYRINYPIYSAYYKHQWDEFQSFLRLRRRGNTFEFYVAKVLTNGKHTNAMTKFYTTTDEKYLGRLKYLSIFQQKNGTDASPQANRIFYVQVKSLSNATVDQTPYIAYAGDEITFDHNTRSITINGIDRTDLKDFGAKYFSIAKGNSVISSYPPGAFNVNVSYKERFR